MVSEALFVNPQARTNAEALHSLKSLGEDGAEEEAQALGKRMGLNPTFTDFSALDKLFLVLSLVFGLHPA